MLQLGACALQFRKFRAEPTGGNGKFLTRRSRKAICFWASIRLLSGSSASIAFTSSFDAVISQFLLFSDAPTIFRTVSPAMAFSETGSCSPLPIHASAPIPVCSFLPIHVILTVVSPPSSPAIKSIPRKICSFPSFAKVHWNFGAAASQLAEAPKEKERSLQIATSFSPRC